MIRVLWIKGVFRKPERLNVLRTFFSDIADNVENLWVLSLALKLLHNSLKMADNCMIEELYTPDFIQCLVSVASKGTGFSQQWLLKDLEVCTQTVTHLCIIFVLLTYTSYHTGITCSSVHPLAHTSVCLCVCPSSIGQSVWLAHFYIIQYNCETSKDWYLTLTCG